MFVTAGHCVDDIDNNNFPDGLFVDFNVPLSDDAGETKRTELEDQYVVCYDSGSIESGFFPEKKI